MSEMQQSAWTKPAAMAIPKGGFAEDKVEQGRYGPIFPKTPACYGFSILAKIIRFSQKSSPAGRRFSMSMPRTSRRR
jgi:hypothetical protein